MMDDWIIFYIDQQFCLQRVRQEAGVTSLG